MNSQVLSRFKKLVDVNAPIIYINEYDFVRADACIAAVIGGMEDNESGIVEWNPGTSCIEFFSKGKMGSRPRLSLHDFLLDEYNLDSDLDEMPPLRFIVLREIQDFIELPEIKSILQSIATKKLYDDRFNTSIIIVSSVVRVPDELKEFVSYVEIPLPNEEEINTLIDEHYEANGNDKNILIDELRNSLMPSLKGLTYFQIDRLLDMALSREGRLDAKDTEMLLNQKKSIVKKSGLLDLVEVREDTEIGGLRALIDYLDRKKKVFDDLGKAHEFGVDTPKGVFLLGMPGCGKSLCAKVASRMLNAPLLKFDMGSLMGKYVGESEERMRSAIKIAEAAAPCVLWIDEIEKAFSGADGSGSSDSGLLRRMFGYFLSWMQEKTSSVYVVATANSASHLPPELKRKGRFDEIFYVDLPKEDEREMIFKIHLKKHKQEGKITDFEEIVRKTEGYSGADIESVVNEAVEKCFIDNKSLLTTKVLLDVIKETRCISQTCYDQIEAMRRDVKSSSFKDANTGEVSLELK